MNLSECSSPAVIGEILKVWPNIAKTAALTMIQKYGPPDEAVQGASFGITTAHGAARWFMPKK
jgi:hypothetical protein